MPRVYPLYDALRRRFDCDMNFDLNRLARSTSAGSVQGLSGRDARDIPRRGRTPAGALARRADHHLLAGRLSGVQGVLGPRDAVHHGVPSVTEIADRRPHRRREPRRSGRGQADRRRRLPDDHPREERRCRGTRSAPASSRRAAMRSSARTSASRRTTRSMTPKWVTGVNFLFPNGLQLPMPFIPGPTPHIYRKFADHHVDEGEPQPRSTSSPSFAASRPARRMSSSRRGASGTARRSSTARSTSSRPTARDRKSSRSSTRRSATASTGSSSARSTTRPI